MVAGGGHVGRAVAVEASASDSTSRCSTIGPSLPTRLSSRRDQRAAARRGTNRGFPLDADSFVVFVTRDHRQDSQALAICIHRPLAYLGMIGSRRKVALVRKNFLDSWNGNQAEEFDRVRAPLAWRLAP